MYMIINICMCVYISLYMLVCVLHISLIPVHLKGYISLYKGIILAYRGDMFLYVCSINIISLFIWVYIFIIDNCYHLDFMEQEIQIKKTTFFIR